MSNLLSKLSNKYDCDKSDKNHKYTGLYHKRFEKDRTGFFELVEFGFGLGKSVKMWLEYFINIKMTTVDIRDPPKKDKLITRYIQDGRLEYINTTQINKGLLKPLLENKAPYIIIDDASHVAEDQQFTLGFAFPTLQKGGWYVIEDLKCKRRPNKLFSTKADKTLVVLNTFLISKIFSSKILSKDENLYLTKNIEKVEIFDKIAFIKKKE